MNLSYWEQQTYFSNISVAIIGSGIVGLNAAIQLKSHNPKAVIQVFERGVLPSGASTKNAGFACFGSVSELLSDLDKYSENEVFTLVERRWRGLQKLRQILGDNAIQFENYGGYELFDKEDFYTKCADKIAVLNQHLAEIVGKNAYQIADKKIKDFGFEQIKHLIFNAYEGQIHTGKMMKALTEKARNMGVEILNGVCIESIHQIETGVDLVLQDDTIIKAQQALVTTNGFARQLLPELDVVPGRGQVIVTKPIPHLRLEGTFHYDEGYYYFRNIDGCILLGGGRNLDFEAEATTQFGFTDLVQDKLQQLLLEVILPNQPVDIQARWSGIMGFGSQQAPIVKQVSEHVFCAVKMQGMGVALGSLVGEEVAELLINNL